jgi:hypothetical protein
MGVAHRHHDWVEHDRETPSPYPPPRRLDASHDGEHLSSADRLAETHSAWVVLLGDHAYKIKKPVKLDFLDFSTREAREIAVHREVDLNRRLAPDVYSGVADVLGPDGTPCEHVIVMRRMPDDRRLSTLVTAGATLDGEIRQIARRIAAFHERTATSPEITRAGSPEIVAKKLDADLDQMQALAAGVLEAGTLEQAGAIARRFLHGRSRLLESRMADGHIRDGHGDLLADDIFCLPDGPRILDCIDFDDTLRYSDVIADIAFLAMDLERLGAPQLASRLLTWYSEFCGASAPASLTEYYVAARALVRSKVACIRVTQGDATALPEATELLQMALTHLRRGAVKLVVIGGPPGTGKSTLATALADRLGWVAFHSDEVRKDLVGLDHRAAAADVDEGIYDARTTESTYGELLRRAKSMLELGESVILDASWSSAAHRADASRMAAAASADLIEIRCDVPATLAAERIDHRARMGNQPSDATPTVAAAMRARFEEWPSAFIVHTDDSIDRTLTDAIAVIEGD